MNFDDIKMISENRRAKNSVFQNDLKHLRQRKKKKVLSCLHLLKSFFLLQIIDDYRILTCK